VLRELGGEKVDRLERSHSEEPGAVYGFVRNRSPLEKSPGPSLFVTVETPVEQIAKIVGHEFYHWRYSRPGLSNATDEAAADAFGVRVEKEMEQEAAREADKKWRASYRELQLRKK
jgi:hypothetical protein